MREWQIATTVAVGRLSVLGNGVTGQPHSPRQGSQELVEGACSNSNGKVAVNDTPKILGSIVSGSVRLTGKRTPSNIPYDTIRS